ncbi:hypothetical protein UA08_05294 [Talaromyces atroroseus]|uniref:Uncharacterized protein n=1 Tax=Talaromyces atroroseus TaxID=1441469 RepID=A0A225AEK0_TALAT|nr:hypothetical protein UA08_05294 [Talaromyces atroroseus]OKL59701.1 hypothetical protein UA08_05294 [Talaromyces atroroseus]
MSANGTSISDPLDAVDYDPIAHLNGIFSHPSTLSAVSQTSEALRRYQNELDSDIARLVEEQVTSNAESVQRIQTAKADLSELFKKIDDVRERASKTEQSITDMTADIKQLDNAKKNLTVSMTALKRLQMLTTAYEQLRALAKTRQYRDCAQLLQAVIQLMAHFKSYRSIDQIATLSRNVADVQRELLEQVCEDFEITFAKGEVLQKRVMLSEACLVMDALGDNARSRLTTWYCNTQLREYRQVFRGNEEAGSLDNISRRYSWFRRMLKTYDDEHTSIFPPSWRVNEVLANTFCESTRDDFKGILSRKLSISNIPWTEDTVASSTDSPISMQSISEAFEPYLGLWVEAQDKQLSTLLPKYRQQPLKREDEEFHAQLVISSSTELFTFYRHSLAQCAKLSTSGSLAELSKVFAKYLDQYAQQVLLNYISERATTQTPSKVPSIEDLILVLNTADYCYTTSNQLEEKIKERIDENLKNTVDFESQADAFMGIASAAVRGLVRKVEVQLEPCWREMRNFPWNKLENVGDQSPYVGELLAKTKAQADDILLSLHKQQYARAFADNIVEFISNTFISTVYSCRPVSETGAEQMLLDLYTLKSGLTSLLPSPAPAGFVKRVNSSFTKVDCLLKTVQVRPSPPEALVQAYLLHIADRSEANFRRMLEIKGIRSKQEQNQLVELFNLHRASDRHAPNLQQSNPLFSSFQSSSTSASGPGTASTVSQGLSNLGTTATTSIGTPGRFDPTMLGSAIISAAKDGVERFPLGSGVTTAAGHPHTGSGPTSPGAGLSGQQRVTSESFEGSGVATSASAATQLNENLKNIGKFFRRDLGGFGGRFGRSTEDATR